MQAYIELGKKILSEGRLKENRTGVDTIGLFGEQLKFDLSEGFPLLTTKKMSLKSIIAELLWFLEGSTDNNRLRELGATIWDEWATEDGDLGPIYGKQWTNWNETKIVSFHDDWLNNKDRYIKEGYSLYNHFVEKDGSYPGSTKMIIIKQHNQIAELINNLKTKPFSRRHIVSAWNIPDLPNESISPQENVKQGKMALAPCHCLFQFYVEKLTPEEIVELVPENLLTEFSTACSIADPNLLFDKDKLQLWCEENNVPTKRLSCQLYQR